MAASTSSAANTAKRYRIENPNRRPAARCARLPSSSPRIASSAPSLMTDIACRSAVRVISPAPPNREAPPPSPDQRQLVVLVERRRRRQRPFERRGARPPGIVRGLFLAHERLHHAEEEDQRPEARHERPERGDQVPAG